MAIFLRGQRYRNTAEFQSSIFAPFKRLHGPDRPGSGIGLAVCKKLVERYKGKIWVKSEKASGSIFSSQSPRRNDLCGSD